VGEAGPVARVGRNDFKQLPAQGLAGRVAAEPAQRQQRRGGWAARAYIARRGAAADGACRSKLHERSAADARATRAAAAAAAPRPPVIAVISHKS
jgi:hypothetical protein